MTSGTRAPTTKERENNKRRERKRRAIAARIFAGLRQFGNYKLPKHCDNNEVLKALCREAGWIVEEDGTTYKQGCRPPPVERSDVCMSSTASPASSSYNQAAAAAAPSDGVSLIPWLKGLSSSGVTIVAPGMNAVGPSSSSRNPSLPPLQIMRGGTCSAPVTPPLSSPRMAAVKPEWGAPDGSSSRGGGGGGGGDAMSSDCAATAFSNAFHSQFPFMTAASGTSTPTYPPAFIVSGASTPTHFGLASGASTPFLPSGASTPTHSSSLNVLRNVSFHFASAANNPFVLSQDREGPANPHVLDAIPVQKDKLASTESHGDSVVKEITEKLASNVAMADVKASVTPPVSLKRPAPQGQLGTDQSSLWPPFQNEQAITAQLAAAVPDARSIVPENFRAEVEMDVARRRQRMKSYLVKPWEGETIHEVSIEEDDLELTLGNSTTKASSTPASSTFNAAMSID